jgi:hypothetical protein
LKITNKYKPRPIRFIEIYQEQEWNIKTYSISIASEFVSAENIAAVKLEIPQWLQKSKLHHFQNYKTATLIIHEGREGCFAIINWWVGENMLQHFVYLKKNGQLAFELFSESGITTCVWEMAILWHERNAWVNHVLMNHENPDFDSYLNAQLNSGT